MYNDCWGEVGWTIIDYYLRRKPSFYGVKRAFEPVRLILRKEGCKVLITGCNDTLEEQRFKALVGWFALAGGGRTREVEIMIPPCSKGVVLELDTGNAIEGGGDPVQVMARHAARKKLIHLKPWSRQAGFEVTLGDPGDENDYPAIIAAAGENCEWLIVESEDFRTDELDNAQMCLAALKKLLEK
jgi:sugar phosphate isomerase/epimerase